MGKERGGEEKESWEKNIKWPTHSRDALYLSDLTSRASEASFRDFSIALVFQGGPLASILHLETLRL